MKMQRRGVSTIVLAAGFIISMFAIGTVYLWLTPVVHKVLAAFENVIPNTNIPSAQQPLLQTLIINLWHQYNYMFVFMIIVPCLGMLLVAWIQFRDSGQTPDYYNS